MAGPLGIVSGSGLDLSALLSDVTGQFAFTDELGFAIDELAGHKRTFVRGRCREREIVLQCGRLHFYEGYTYHEVVSTVDVMHALGVRTAIFTNVAGGLRADMQPGEIVSIREVRTWPFERWERRPERITPDFTVPGCDREGVYYWMHGPSYETPAEVRALQILGGDVVGMSTAPDAARCKELGIRCAAISVVTNNCCSGQVLTHEDVVRVAKMASQRLIGVLAEGAL